MGPVAALAQHLGAAYKYIPRKTARKRRKQTTTRLATRCGSNDPYTTHDKVQRGSGQPGAPRLPSPPTVGLVPVSKNTKLEGFVRDRLGEDSSLKGAVKLLPEKSSSRNTETRNKNGALERQDNRMLLLDHPSLAHMQYPEEYNPHVMAEFWSKHPEAVSMRLNQVMGVFSQVIGQFSFNVFTGTLQRTSGPGQLSLQDTIIKLGPAFIKFGQTLSTRSDLFDEATLEELRQLCFMVPTFDVEEAIELIEEELGSPVDRLFSEFNREPVAAASLGQVYRARLRESGGEVAVKIQRPHVMQTVACDLFLIRRICVAVRGFTWIPIDLVGVVDDFAVTFFRELDYLTEGKNADYFAWTVRHLPSITVPKHYRDYSTRSVLTMDWIEGVHISEALRSNPGDVEPLVRVGIQCYLTQLLHTGFFHGDPHSGNLIVMSNGNLGIIDFGQMINVPDYLKYRMLEASVHFYHRDYKLLVEDIRELGFVDKNMELGPLAQDLEAIMNQLVTVTADGSVAVNVNIAEINRRFNHLEDKYNMEIPTQLVSLSRCLTMLEGMAMECNPDFQLVHSSFPFILEQLLRDRTPRVRAALRYLIYGPSGVFDMQRFITMVEILESNSLLPNNKEAAPNNPPPENPFDKIKSPFDMVTSSIDLVKNSFDQPALSEGQPGSARDEPKAATSALSRDVKPVLEDLPKRPAADRTVELRSKDFDEAEDRENEERKAGVQDAVSTLVADEFFRDILVEEVVKGIDAVSRQILARLTIMLGMQKLKVPLPIMGAGSWLSMVPLSPKVTTEDRYIIANGRYLLDFVWKRVSKRRSERRPHEPEQPVDYAEVVPMVASVVADLLPEVWTRLLERMHQRLLRDLKR